ncbi:DUF6214 family protein [Streptomyces spongiae]|uniref:DUF6214 family protein n=1 Tax=Streptomyces spongiae TaxID=565072 RepID=UPI002AD28B9A|nr:DUF6214 family protein [Streptomyces spongiae]
MWPAWEVQERDGATAWYNARLAFPDGARVDLLAVVTGGHVLLEEVRAQPPLSLDDLTVLADWVEGPLFEACGARSAWPHGVEGSRRVAEEYRAAQEQGVDPVLAVMRATGHNRRRSLKLIAGARDEGFLTPRHQRR